MFSGITCFWIRASLPFGFAICDVAGRDWLCCWFVDVGEFADLQQGIVGVTGFPIGQNDEGLGQAVEKSRIAIGGHISR